MNIFRNMASIAIIVVLFFILETGLSMHLNAENSCPMRCQQSKGGENVIKGGERFKFYYFSQTKKECRQATGKGPWRQPSHEENRFRSRQECQETCGNCWPTTRNSMFLRSPPDDNDFGCYDGYCWTRCSSVVGDLLKEWCYTTKSFSQSFDYASCKNQKDCNSTWSCGGSCTAF